MRIELSREESGFGATKQTRSVNDKEKRERTNESEKKAAKRRDKVEDTGLLFCAVMIAAVRKVERKTKKGRRRECLRSGNKRGTSSSRTDAGSQAAD